MSSRWLVRLLLLAVAVVSMVFGLERGEAGIVLRKAVRVCMECIGLG